MPTSVKVPTRLTLGDTAGVLGAIFAALCCAGAPFIISVLATLGLSFLRNDRILLPLLALALGVALWGFARDARAFRIVWPFALALTGAVMLAAGVVVLHGTPARAAIDIGAIILIAATVWKAWARRACAASTVSTSTS